MNFILRNKFWIGIWLSVLVLAIFYVGLVMPKRRQIKNNIAILEGDSDTLELLQTKGTHIATKEKIDGCRKTIDILKKQHDKALDFFSGEGEEKIEYWPDVLDPLTGAVHGAVFKEKYEEEGLALEKKLKKKGLKVGEWVFEWVDFGAKVPTAEECEPVMTDFRIVEHVVDLILQAEAIASLNSVRLGGEKTLVLTVGDAAFYSRSLEIDASVFYSKLLFLIAKLHKSRRNIVVETISIKQAEVAMAKEREKPPVLVTITCGMLQRGEPPSDKGT